MGGGGLGGAGGEGEGRVETDCLSRLTCTRALCVGDVNDSLTCLEREKTLC